MEIKRVPIDQVENWKDNPRNTKIKDFNRLKAQIVRLGIYKPILCFPEEDKYITLGGNTRLRALRELGHTEVDISIIHPKDDAEKLMYALSDNDRISEYDDQGLAELTYKQKDQMPFEIFRFDVGNTISVEHLLNQYGPSGGGAEEDTIPKPDPVPETEIGDIYQLGPHRLLCGDSTHLDCYEALLEGAKADLVFTDPPENPILEGSGFKKIMNDNMEAETFIQFTTQFMSRLAENTKKGGVFYICSGYSSYPAFVYGIKFAGMTYSGPIIWVKNQTSMGWEDYKKKHEMILKAKNGAKKATPILYGWNGGAHYFAKDKIEADVWEASRRASATMLHPTQKPLEIVQRAIRNSSRPKEMVLDPFGGSGTTLIAADREGRTARLIEMDPIFCDVIIRRYAALGAFTEEEIRATKTRMEFQRKSLNPDGTPKAEGEKNAD